MMMLIMMIGVDPGFPVGFMIRLFGCYGLVTEYDSCHSGTRYIEGEYMGYKYVIYLEMRIGK